MSYVIQYGIPLPAPKGSRHKRNGGSKPWSPLTLVMEQMEVGGSFAVKTDAERCAVTSRMVRMKPREFTIRSVDDGSFRVWRVA